MNHIIYKITRLHYYDRVVQLLEEKNSVMDIHRQVGVTRNTVYISNISHPIH
ncbi:helix-turn-helix domain-containing protein [Oceanobacillus longus]|uniref:Helix-turn-helix domain-containing protein n=1 Tax=Oceanobacillus longus TaxID=930120 RepID=A0ABV8H3H7_9BACI